MSIIAMSDRIDIQKPLYELCDLLGIDPKNTAELLIRPKWATATIYHRDDDGRVHIDLETTRPSISVHIYDIST